MPSLFSRHARRGIVPVAWWGWVLAALMPAGAQAQDFGGIATATNPPVPHELCVADATYANDIDCSFVKVFVNPSGTVGFLTSTTTGAVGGSSSMISATTISATTLNAYDSSNSFITLTVGGVLQGIPAGAVAAFDLASCPVGWSAFSDGVGRSIVGVGTMGNKTYARNDTGGASTVSMASGNLPAHTHTVDPPNTASTADTGHTHSADPNVAFLSLTGAHTHSFDAPDTESNTSSIGNHTHNVVNMGGTGKQLTMKESGSKEANTSYLAFKVTAVTDGQRMNGGAPYNFGTTSSSGAHTHTISFSDQYSELSGDHAHTVDIAQFTTGAGSSHYHTVDVDSFTSGSSGSGTALDIRDAYIGLLYCSKD